MPTVFISHSSITDLNAADVRKHLKQELEHRGWAVRVDIDELKGGEEWTGVLYHWLADCDAAVVLLGQTAINSKWVLREVTLLLWRMALNSPVAVVPVLLADITSADVRNSQLSELRSLQFVKQHDTASGSAQDPASLAMRIAERLPDLSGLQRESSDSMTKWVATVVDCLGDITEIGPL